MSSVGMYYKDIYDSLKNKETKIPIVVPSYQRPNASTLKWISECSLCAYVFIRKEEYDLYKQWENFNNIHIVTLKNVSNIGETRAAIMKYCLKHEIYKAFQLDDDITEFDYLYEYQNSTGKSFMRSSCRNEGKKEKINPVAFKVWSKVISNIEKESNEKIAICGIPMRQFSWNIPNEPYRLDKDLPIQCIYINYKLLEENGVCYESSDFVGWEDFDIAVKARRKGLHIARVYGLTYSSPPMCKDTGGCNGEEPEKTCYNRSKRLSDLFMENVAKDDPAFYIKELPKHSLVVVRCHWDKLRI